MLQQPDAVHEQRKRGISKVLRLSPAGPKHERLQVVISGKRGAVGRR